MTYRTNPQAKRMLTKGVRDTFKLLYPPPSLTISQFADQHRYLTSEASAETGRWLTSRVEYQREMMDCITDPKIEYVTIMSAAQIGKSEVLINTIFYYAVIDPSPIMWVIPTLALAEDYSKTRLEPAIRESQLLSDTIHNDDEDASSTILYKKFRGGQIVLTGANSPASLRGRPIRILLLDEVDAYKPTSEGDVIELAKMRTTNFYNRKVIQTSTPTIKDMSAIERDFLESDMRYFYVPCPQCGMIQRLMFKNFKYQADLKNNITDVYMECEHCHKRIEESDKLKMVANGKWIATDPSKTNHAGFHLPAMYSPWVTWKEIAERWVKANVNKTRMTLQPFINGVLAETIEVNEAEYSLDTIKLGERVEKYDKVPDGVLVLTAGVDVQIDRIEMVVKGWGKEEESWLIDYQILIGDPAQPQIWAQLDDKLKTTYEHISGIQMPIVSVGIDSGNGNHTDHIYRYCVSRFSERIYALKGRSGRIPIVTSPTRNNKYRVPLFIVGVDTAKDVIYSRLGIDNHGNGYIHFKYVRPDMDEYFLQLTAEHKIHKYVKGQDSVMWKKKHPSARNEALDTEVYALASFRILNANMAKVEENFKKQVAALGPIVPEEPKKTQVNQVPRPQRIRIPHTGGGWAKF